MEASKSRSRPKAQFTIYYNAGQEHYDLKQELKPHEQMWVDVGKLIYNQIPDMNGQTLPRNLTTGSYEIQDLVDRGVGGLFEGKVILDKTFGYVAYGCATCCGYSDGPWMYYDPIGAGLAFTNDQDVWDIDFCTQKNTSVLDWMVSTSWGTGSSAIATASRAVITGVGVGSTTNFVNGTLMIGGVQSKRCPQGQVNPNGGANVIRISCTPSSINMSAGDTNVTITANASPASVASGEAWIGGGTATDNPNSSTAANLSFKAPSSFTGSDPWTFAVQQVANSPSGIFTVYPCTDGVCSSNTSTVIVPPQLLIQMMYAEANGTGNQTAMQSLGETIENRFSSSYFTSQFNTWQNSLVPGQVALNTSITTGVQPELNAAVSVFRDNNGGWCGALAWWSPTSMQWSTVQTAINSGTSTFPSNIGAPTYSNWPTSSQQILHVSSVGTASNGQPNFLYLAPRTSSQAAAVSTSCD